MSFKDAWVNLIMRCISSVSCFININGQRRCSFKPSRGLCQKDPLSPFLFLICSEGLSTLLRLALGSGQI